MTLFSIISTILAAALTLTPDFSTNATVCAPVAYLRAEPSYEAGLETQLLMGVEVEVLEKEGIWRKVKSKKPDYTAWTTEFEICECHPDSDTDKLIFVGEHSWIFAGPSTEAERLSPITMGCMVRTAGESKTINPAYSLFTDVLLPDGRKGFILSDCLMSVREWKEIAESSLGNRESAIDNILSLARRFLGTTYLWGGNSVDGFDCSGYVMFIFGMNGIELPRNASQQVLCGKEVLIPEDTGNPGDKKNIAEELLPGDLLFYGKRSVDSKTGRIRESITHVAIYIGDGHLIQSSGIVRICSFDEYPRPILKVRRIL